MRTVVPTLVLLALVAMPPLAGAQKTRQTGAARATAGVKPPSAANRFVTVVEFQRAKRPANANVSVEGYIVLTEKAGRQTARLSLVDSTDKVLNAQDATKTARTGAPCTVAVGARQHPWWVLTAKGLNRLTMYAQTGRLCAPVNDSPPKVRIQGNVGADKRSIAKVTKIEYHDDFGEWRELK